MSRPRHSLRVITQPGLEEVTARELVALGLCPQAQAGAVVVTGGLRAVYAANLRLRTATRVLVQLARFEAPSFHALTRRLGDLDLDPWLPPAGVVHARATSHKSRLHHTGAIEARVIEALQARGREAAPGRAPGERPVAQLFVRLVRDRCTVSVDTSGAPLHRRGYRLAVAKAPLRETLAAAVVLESGYRPPAPLVDPLCGAGTLAIEAALLGRSLAPGRRRRFAFMDAAGFNRGLWASVVGEARAEEQTWPKPQVFASDRDAGAVAASRDNAARADVEGDIAFTRASLTACAAPPREHEGSEPRGYLVTNPPYGRRVGGGDLRDLHARLGQVARERFAGYRAAIVSSDAALVGHTGLGLRPARRLTSGGLPVTIFVGDVPR